MSAEYMHIGIPITNKKPGMTYNEGAKFWVSNVDDYDYKIEYLKFEEGTPFPEVLHRCPHVAYKVDSLEKYIADAAASSAAPCRPTTRATSWPSCGRTGPSWSCISPSRTILSPTRQERGAPSGAPRSAVCPSGELRQPSPSGLLRMAPAP